MTKLGFVWFALALIIQISNLVDYEKFDYRIGLSADAF